MKIFPLGHAAGRQGITMYGTYHEVQATYQDELTPARKHRDKMRYIKGPKRNGIIAASDADKHDFRVIFNL